MHKLKQGISLMLLTLVVAACTQDPETPPTATKAPISSSEATAVATNTPEPTSIPPTPSAEPADEPAAETAVPEQTDTVQAAVFSWPGPSMAYDELSRAPVSPAEQATFNDLENSYPPERNNVALAVAYRGLTALTSTAPAAPNSYTAGIQESFNIRNIDLNTFSSPEFVLRFVSDHAYFWFDTTPGLAEPGEEALAAAGAAFDQIYEQNIAIFGSENNPGIDGDSRIHIVNASPLSVCDVTEANARQCRLGGYFGAGDILPQSVDPNSNEREMFVMNGSFFGSGTYLDILTHEFRHMIESNYDVNDWDWAVEGSAMLAEDLLGFANDPIGRGNLFLTNPDQQLNRWVDGNTLPHYGQGYLFNRYIYNRLGPELYKSFATHPEPGLTAVSAIAAENNLDFDGIGLYLDWLAALAIHNDDNAPEIYRLRQGLNTAATTDILNFPTAVNTTVNQYAADYYRFLGDGPATVSFTGSNHVPLLEVLPPSGSHAWTANRANYSHMRLTREFDLSGVDSASLEYAVFHDIEVGYDFAYASISTDGGQTWQGLVGSEMQGKAAVDDPANAAYTDRFYTGRSSGWVKETADLTPYAGQAVQIRFEYVTDQILTFGGIALDNIAIPEINFYDDAENDNGWLAEGFVRATGYLPQRWHLLLITYEAGAPVVTSVTLTEDNTAVVDFSLNNGASGGPPLLIVAATAPMTLEPAHYQFEIRQ